MRKRLIASVAAGAAALAAAGVAIAATVTVSPSGMDGWSAVNDTCGAA